MSRPGSHQSISGIRAGGVSSEPPRPIPYPAEDVADPVRPRHVLDYVLARRAVLEQIKHDALLREQVCDADPYLLRAAKFHGEPSGRKCPICRSKELIEVRYTFGDQLGQYSGRIKSTDELIEMQNEFGQFRVYVVEVCRNCHWNHLHLSYLLGDGQERKAPRKVRTLEDEDWVS